MADKRGSDTKRLPIRELARVIDSRSVDKSRVQPKGLSQAMFTYVMKLNIIGIITIFV